MTWDDKSDHRYTVEDIDINSPNGARVYDAFLGGKDNFAVDRELVRQAMEIAPKAPLAAKANRAFLARVVRYLVGEAGLTQLLDIGSGLPTQGNVSEVAHDIDKTVHVVHVDNDPVVYTHSKALLADTWTTDFIIGDIRRPREIIDDPGVRKLIDFGRPVGLLLFAILHHVEDSANLAGVTADLRDAMPVGSYLALSSLRMPGPEVPELRAATFESERLLAGAIGSARWREDEEIKSWFGDWEMVEPGYVSVVEWRPPEKKVVRDELYHGFFGGVARKTSASQR